MKIVEYTVENIDDVQAAINAGYQPWGSPFERTIVKHVSNSYQTEEKKVVAQAMVKYEEETTEVTLTNAGELNGTYQMQRVPIIENPPATLDRGN